MSNLIQDLRFAIRILARSPAFTAIAVATLALGIGATTAVFTVVDHVTLRALNYNNPDRIVRVTTRFTETGREASNVSGPDFHDLREQTTTLAELAYHWGGEMGATIGDLSEFAEIHMVSDGFFQVFGVQPAHGRFFDSGEDSQVAIVSHSFALARFSDAKSSIGETIQTVGRSLLIVGVAPEGFDFPRKADIWAPAGLFPETTSRTAHNYRAVGVLKPGTTSNHLQAEFETIGARLAEQHPDANGHRRFGATPLKDYEIRNARETLAVLMGAIALVLLIACVNVANLLLARTSRRAGEIGLRAALGAGRGRIIAQLLAESFIIASAAGTLGFALARALLSVLLALAPSGLPRIAEVQLDLRILAFTFAISLLSVLIFGLIPAFQAAKPNLLQGFRRGISGSTSRRLRQSLVAGQVAIAFVLAIGGGLLLRTFVELQRSDLGFRTEGVLVAYANVQASNLEEHKLAATDFRDLLAELQTIPGIGQTAATMGLPMGRYGSNGGYAVEGRHDFGTGRDLPQAGFRITTPGYFRALDIPLLSGRDFEETDLYDRPFVAIVSQSLADESFPDEDPLGKRIRCGLDSPEFMTVVGVVADIRQDSPAAAPGPQLYMPYHQHPYYANELQLVLRTSSPPQMLVPAVRTRVAEFNSEIPLKFTTMDAMLADSVALPRFQTTVLIAFAGLSLLLALAGVYSVTSYLVSEQTRDFGVRSALGARPAGILVGVLANGFQPALVGLALGALASLWLRWAVEGLLFETSALDPLTYAAVTALLLLAIGASLWIPARRAASVDPIAALRHE